MWHLLLHLYKILGIFSGFKIPFLPSAESSQAVCALLLQLSAACPQPKPISETASCPPWGALEQHLPAGASISTPMRPGHLAAIIISLRWLAEVRAFLFLPSSQSAASCKITHKSDKSAACFPCG